MSDKELPGLSREPEISYPMRLIQLPWAISVLHLPTTNLWWDMSM